MPRPRSAAAVLGEPKVVLRIAADDARRMTREGTAWATPFASLIHTGISAFQCRDAEAKTLLEEAITGFEQVDMGLFTAALRHRLGELIGGSQGPLLIQQADLWMAGQEIRNPARMAALLVPGFRT